MTRLGDEAVLEGDEERGNEGSGSTTFECAHGHIRKRYERNTHYRGKHAHCDVGNGVVIGLSDLLEVKVSVVSEYESSESN